MIGEIQDSWIRVKDIDQLMKVWSELKPEQEVFIHHLFFDTNLSINRSLHYKITAKELGDYITASVDNIVRLPACLANKYVFTMFDPHFSGRFYLEIIPWAYLEYEKRIREAQAIKFKVVERAGDLGESELQFIRNMMNI